ncbi:hypothetical protein S7711_10826 [Stachybotrys chartarum IBT 7711]|uniref:Uncharacterized protein n=1 Tax=Stachybotrys chartarum (strain CBS 109288 / IBT 7711) TaxID=1280523 RepID=A0A084AJF5_STACB|nr:hypothetical protein S7711_10826 [Stachybotrys chartarum IBT 7711]KFA51172.1 hypothetical protein S40293_10849 [Stachybotrys chartarum IBT 40293]KFA75893.1 hypothetical protein S40288_10674 [Stachybotrys chartarum IBT 40288]
MQFSVLTVFTLFAGAMAARDGFVVVKRNVERQVDVSQPAMTDANGNIVPFNAAGVVQQRRRREAKTPTYTIY